MEKKETNWPNFTPKKVHKLSDFGKTVLAAILPEARCSSGAQKGMGSLVSLAYSPLSRLPQGRSVPHLRGALRSPPYQPCKDHAAQSGAAIADRGGGQT